MGPETGALARTRWASIQPCPGSAYLGKSVNRGIGHRGRTQAGKDRRNRSRGCIHRPLYIPIRKGRVPEHILAPLGSLYRLDTDWEAPDTSVALRGMPAPFHIESRLHKVRAGTRLRNKLLQGNQTFVRIVVRHRIRLHRQRLEGKWKFARTRFVSICRSDRRVGHQWRNPRWSGSRRRAVPRAHPRRLQ